MFRKSISYVFLLIANIVLLVHAVVPHHYHQWQVCVESSHCKRDGITHHQDSSANPHEHDEADSSACALKQAVILPANQDKQVSRNLDRNDNHSHDFVFVLWNVSLPSIKAVSDKIAVLPQITPLYAILFSSSSGLRGPPSV